MSGLRLIFNLKGSSSARTFRPRKDHDGIHDFVLKLTKDEKEAQEVASWADLAAPGEIWDLEGCEGTAEMVDLLAESGGDW